MATISLPIEDLRSIDSNIYNAYKNLYYYFDSKNTLPSLVSWGKEYRKIVTEVTKSVHNYMEGIEEGTMLSPREKDIIKIGNIKDGNDTFMSSIHPLVLSYFLNLFTSIISDKYESFKDLPTVTLQRLSPRGLIPFVFDKETGYALVSQMPENAFWLKMIPSKKCK